MVRTAKFLEGGQEPCHERKRNGARAIEHIPPQVRTIAGRETLLAKYGGHGVTARSAGVENVYESRLVHLSQHRG
jgi:hypothetical protein